MQEPGACVAVTHPSVVRAAIVQVLDAPAASFWRLDIAPASLTDLRYDGRRWRVRATGVRRLT
jgi:broad specificity phosphatase PhoE